MIHRKEGLVRLSHCENKIKTMIAARYPRFHLVLPFHLFEVNLEWSSYRSAKSSHVCTVFGAEIMPLYKNLMYLNLITFLYARL